MFSVYPDFFGVSFGKDFAVPDRFGATVEINRAVMAAHAKAAQDLFASQAMEGRDRMRCAVEELSSSASGERIEVFSKIGVNSMRTQAADLVNWGRLYLETWSNLVSSFAQAGCEVATPPEPHSVA